MNAALMDFSTSIDLNNKDSIEWDNYPLKNSKFYRERWILEIKPEKTKKSISKLWATLIISIHKDHKVYYSKNPDTFEAFILKDAANEHRHFIQEYFEKTYNLEVSVRPAYKYIETTSGNIFYYHAQIQAGNHDFWAFTKSEKTDWEKNFI